LNKIQEELVYKYYKYYRKYKVELEDLNQEAELASICGEDLETHLKKYCNKWSHDKCSSALPLDSEEGEISPIEDRNIQFIEESGRDLLNQIKTVLTKKQFKCWYLSKIKGFKLKEIANRLNISIKGVSIHIKRARENLQKNQKKFKNWTQGG